MNYSQPSRPTFNIRNAYVAIIAVIWAGLVAIGIIGYYLLRFRTDDSPPGNLGYLFAADSLLFFGLGFFVYRAAKKWRDSEMALPSIISRVAWGGVCIALATVIAMCGIHLARTGEAELTGFWQVLVRYGWMNMVIDHLFYWLVVTSVLPLPWIERMAPRSFQGEQSDQYLLVRSAGKVERVHLGDISHVIAADNYVELHGLGRHWLHRMTLSDFARRFGAQGFLRIGRSAVIRTDSIRTLHRNRGQRWEVELADGTHIPVARQYRYALSGHLADQPPH